VKTALLLIAASLSLHAANDPFAENVRTTDPRTPEEQQKTFRLPPGFEAQLVAAEPQLRKPMNMQFDTAGRLWFTESREYPWPTNYSSPRDTIRILSDFDAHGRAHKVTTFATNLNIPIGLYPYQSPTSDGSGKLTWKCVAWSIPNIWLFEDTDGDLVADKKTAIYGPFDHTRDTHGNQSSFRRGFDGWLYAHHGFNNDSHITAKDGSRADMNSGNSYRIRFDGSRIEHHTHGQVNPFGLAFDEFGNMYSSDCHSAPTYQLLAGGYYPSFGKPHDGLGFAPVLMEHSHGSTAIDAMLYYADDLWPGEFQKNIFVGNVMTSRVNRDRLTFNGSSPRANELDDFVKSDDPWFRPVDNLLGPDGAFYVADFYNRIIGHYEVPLPHPGRDRERGRIWRVIYRGADGNAKLRPAAIAADLDGMIGEMASPSLARRMLAMNAIYDRIGKAAASKITAALAKPSNDFHHVHLLWLAHRLDAMKPQDLAAASRSASTAVRVHAQRIAKDVLERAALPQAAADAAQVSAAQAVGEAGLKDADALVQRCAAEVLGKLRTAGSADAVKMLVELRARVPAADTHLLYVVRKSIRDQLLVNGVFQKVLAEKWSEPGRRAVADVAVAVTNSAAASFLLSHLQAVSEPREVTAKMLQHAARFLPEDRIDDLASFVREKFADDLDFQWALFKPILDGLAQRGVEPSFRMKMWGNTLVDGLLSSVRRAETDWIALPVGNNPASPNPWVVQNRKSTDGRDADFLCSLPQGEKLTGILRSKNFAVPATLSLFMAGHDGFPDKPLGGKNFVSLRDADSHDLLTNAPAPRHDVARKVSWDLSAFAGRQAFLELVDADTAGAYAWLAVGRFDPAVVALPKVTPKLIDERLQAVAQIARATRDDSLEPQLLAAMKIPAGPDTRASLATTLLALNTKQLAPCAEILSDANAPTAARQKVAQALGDANTVESRELLLGAVRTAPERAQVKLALALAVNRAGAEALLADVEAGKTSARLLQDRTLKEKIVAAKPANADARMTKLTRSLAPLNEQLQKLIETRRDAFQKAASSATAGVAVFEKACAACHQIDGKGAVVGPQLDGLGARGAERIMEDILDPNRNVDSAFRSTMFILDDGDVAAGLFRREEGEQIVFADASGKEQTIPKKQVKERRPSELSLMPENLADAMTPQEFNDLVAFLLTKSGAKK
jgi:putative heme-binding domain-containing protein